MIRILTRAAIGASLIAAPAMAAAQQAAPAPSVERIDEGSALRSSYFLPLAGLVVLVIAVLLLTGEDGEAVPLTP